MKRFAVLIVMVLALVTITGCPNKVVNVNGDAPAAEQYVTCADAVAYITTIDAALKAMPPSGKEVELAKAWYAVARAGAVAYLAKKCPEVVATVAPVTL